MTQYDDPNREAVGLDPAWVEGDGGGGDAPPPEPEVESKGDGDLEALTKAELLELARTRGISPANNDMTKAELIASIEASG